VEMADRSTGRVFQKCFTWQQEQLSGQFEYYLVPVLALRSWQQAQLLVEDQLLHL